MVTIMLVTIGAIASILTPIVIQYYNEKQTPFSYQVIIIVVLSMLVAYVLQVILIIFRENFTSTFNVNYLFQLIEKLINVQYDELIKREPTYL
ncbi:MAG: ABC transporter ATP-binding protein, partial [Vagococcus sp.]